MPKISKELQIKNIKRVKTHGEVMTAKKEVCAMLDLLENKAFKPDFKFLEPACGNGNFLVEILNRKLDFLLIDSFNKNDILEVLKSIYAVDILSDNIKEAKKRMFDLTQEFYLKTLEKPPSCSFKKEIKSILNKNIIQADFLSKGALFSGVKFDCIVGNPPYHKQDGGKGGSSVPIYHLFVQKAKRLKPRYILMIIPAKWFTSGKGLKDFRMEMLNDRHIKVLVDFIDSKKCFPNVFLRGGICYFLRDKNYRGDCRIETHLQDGRISSAIRPLKEKNCDIFIRYNEAISILKKVQSFKEPAAASMITSERPFGLRTFFKGDKSRTADMIKVYANSSIGYIEKNLISKNKELIYTHKIIIPRAIGLGNYASDKIMPLYSEPNSICSETYVVFGPFDTKKEALNAIEYINTNFFRFLLGLRKNTMMASKRVYSFIPLQDFKEEWTDEKLFKKYNFTIDEIEYINSMFKETCR